MHLKHVGNAILFIVAPQHFKLKRRQLKVPPERWHKLAVPFGTAFFLRSVTLVMVLDMRPAHNGNATVCDEI
jgi:hypothetical protein